MDANFAGQGATGPHLTAGLGLTNESEIPRSCPGFAFAQAAASENQGPAATTLAEFNTPSVRADCAGRLHSYVIPKSFACKITTRFSGGNPSRSAQVD